MRIKPAPAGGDGGDGIPPREPTAFRDKLTAYARPDTWRSAFEVAVSVVPFVALWLAMWLAVTFVGYWLALVLALPAAGFLVRLFLIQHDCGHGSLFRSQRVNDWLGRTLAVFTLTPYDLWRRSHALHHAGAGNLDRRGIGDVATLTVEEFRARGRWGRLQYRLYRNPAILFGIGPVLVFLLHHRLPIGFMRQGWMPWVSTMGTNIAIALVAMATAWAVGFGTFVMIHLPIVVLGASAGVWLFYVQHQFEHTEWDGSERWQRHTAALHGASHYDLPGVLRWLSANVGIHHVHHLSSRIPHYRLPEVLRDHPELGAINRLSLAQSLRCIGLALWDEKARRLVSFAAARAQPVG